MMLKGILGLLAFGLSMSLQASEQAPKPEEQAAAPISEKQQVVLAFRESCELRQEAQCGCIAESLVPMLSDAKVTVVQSKLMSGELNQENLIPRNQVDFNRARSKCSGK